MVLKKAVSALRALVLAALCIIPLAGGTAFCEEASPPVQLDAGKEAVPPKAKSGYGVIYFPTTALYAPYSADPRRVDFGLQILGYSRSQIPDSSNLRFDLKSGGQFHFLRIHPQGHEELGWQFSLEAGFNSQFDIMKHLDNIGWDGRYGFLVTNAQSKNLSFRFGYLHDSSHVGDEYMQRTGRLRIGYTREEFAAGASWLTDNGWRFYGEYAHARYMGNQDLQKPGRMQFGVEWQQARPVEGLMRGWYAGADVSAMQERDWRRDISVTTGYRLDTLGKTWRFGVDWYTGRPPISEFFQHNETYLGFGMWVDI